MQPGGEEATLAKRSRSKTILLSAAQAVFPDRQFVSVLKYELSLLMVSVYSKLSPVEWFKAGRRRNASDLKINIGNGPFRHQGWLNLDCHLSLNKDDVVCDLRRRWPLSSASAKYIFSEHVFEHFGYPDEIRHVLRECFRVLRKDGVLRIIVPDAERYLRAYTENDEDFVKQVGGEAVSKISLVNTMMRENGFHKYAYDYLELANILKLVGFRTITRSSLRASAHSELNLDFDDSLRDLVSLYVEASK